MEIVMETLSYFWQIMASTPLDAYATAVLLAFTVYPMSFVSGNAKNWSKRFKSIKLYQGISLALIIMIGGMILMAMTGGLPDRSYLWPAIPMWLALNTAQSLWFDDGALRILSEDALAEGRRLLEATRHSDRMIRQRLKNSLDELHGIIPELRPESSLSHLLAEFEYSLMFAEALMFVRRKVLRSLKNARGEMRQASNPEREAIEAQVEKLDAQLGSLEMLLRQLVNLLDYCEHKIAGAVLSGNLDGVCTDISGQYDAIIERVLEIMGKLQPELREEFASQWRKRYPAACQHSLDYLDRHMHAAAQELRSLIDDPETSGGDNTAARERQMRRQRVSAVK